jgi:hypothetical protein
MATKAPNPTPAEPRHFPILLFVICLVPIGLGVVFWIIRPHIDVQHLLEVQWVHARYAHGVEFIGVRNSETGPTSYFSVRIKGFDGGVIDPECPVVLTWSGKKWKIADLTPESAAEAGIVLEPTLHPPPGSLIGFIGGADDQNRDYGIEFYFSNDRLTEFYARHNDNSSVPCPFLLEAEGKIATAFPISEGKLEEVFGKPENTSAQWGK